MSVTDSRFSKEENKQNYFLSLLPGGFNAALLPCLEQVRHNFSRVLTHNAFVTTYCF